MSKPTPKVWYSLLTAVLLSGVGLASELPAQGSTAQPQGQHPSGAPLSPAAPARDALTKTLVDDLRANGFQVNPGYPMLASGGPCAQYIYPALKSCLASNPIAPYVMAAVKAWPDEQVGPTPSDALGPVRPGYTPFYRLGPRDAIVLYGQMPPPGRYMGWSSYDWSEHGRWKAKDYTSVAGIPNRPVPMQYQFHTIPPDDPRARRVWSWSSLGDIVNNEVMRRQSGDPWGKNRYFITTPSASTDQAIRQALAAQGVPDGDIFTEQVPSRDAYGTIGPLGMGKNAIEFNSFFRYALPNDPVLAQEWWKALPLTVLRVRVPSSLGPVQPYGMLTYERQTTPNPEAYLAGDMNNLIRAVCDDVSGILHLYSTHCSQTRPASSFMVDPYTDLGFIGPYCRKIHMWCGDQNDLALYTAKPLPLDSGQVYAVIDTLATQTGNATYVGLAVLDASTYLAPTGVTDTDLKGSADRYAARVNNTAKFFVHYFTRDCTILGKEGVLGRLHDCTTISADMVPELGSTTAFGDPTLYGSFIPVMRDYIAPGTERGPNSAQLLIPRILAFTP